MNAFELSKAGIEKEARLPMLYMNVRFIWAILLVLALTIFPLPSLIHSFRPAFLLLFVLYLQIFMPRFFSIGLVVIVGLFEDVLLSTLLGEHVFALMLVCWIISGTTRRFNFFPISQQMLLILLLCILYQCTILIINASQGFYVSGMSVLVSSMLSMILWPWVRILADSILFRKLNLRC